MENSSQDGCQALVAPFQALNSSAHQRRALSTLVKALTHQQIRELRLSLEEVDLRCDIIAKLPLELSQIILRHLPLYQVFQARRVSPQWKHFLSSPQTVEPLLRDWFSAPATDTALHIPDGLSASSILSLKAEHIEAYLTGHAFTYASHEWGRSPDHTDFGVAAHLVAYADGIMAWVDTTDSHFVKSLDLKTGQEWLLFPEARTRVNSIAMSSSMIAALGSGRCHVWNRVGDPYCLRLPSNKGQEIAVSGETLAIVARLRQTDPREASSRMEVITWTLKDQKTSSFCVTLPPREAGYVYRMKSLLDSKGESLLLIEQSHSSRYEKEGTTHFHYMRTNLDGDVLTQGVLQVPDTRYYHKFTEDAVPKEDNGQAVIWSFAKRQHDWDNFSELMIISYNFRKDRLEVRTQEVTALRIMKPELKSSLFHWKGAAYFLNYDPEAPDLRVIDLQDSTCSEAKMDFSSNTPNFDLPPHEDLEEDTILIGDEIFLIGVFAPGFCVWCFDANIRMFKEDLAYTEKRKSNIDRRIRSKQNRKSPSSDDSITHKLE